MLYSFQVELSGVPNENAAVSPHTGSPSKPAKLLIPGYAISRVEDRTCDRRAPGEQGENANFYPGAPQRRRQIGNVSPDG